MSDQQGPKAEFFAAGDLEGNSLLNSDNAKAYPYITSRLWKPGHVDADSRIWSKSLEWISTLDGGEGAHGRVYRVMRCFEFIFLTLRSENVTSGVFIRYYLTMTS